MTDTRALAQPISSRIIGPISNAGDESNKIKHFKCSTPKEHQKIVKFRTVEISNLRAIRRVEFDGLGDLVLIAGPNGVGKSCVLDGLRLLKSAYAGYQTNEVHSWFSEFQIDLNQRDENFNRIFRDPNEPLFVRASIELAQCEREYLRDNAEELVRQLAWRTVAPGHEDPYLARRAPLARELRAHEPEVEARLADDLPEFLDTLEKDLLTAKLELSSRTKSTYERNLVLEVLWATFDPAHLGILDFHSAHRAYQYERLGNINLNIQNTDERVRQHALYQTQSKYSNIKSEMAAALVRDLIAKQAGANPEPSDNIIHTLKELFLRFFPGKEFLGPVPATDGSLSFPVRLASDGSVHDVDFLSSGEKEVLFGYLRLRNTAPRNSVIMIDEPELHLNPRLVKGLPNFYHENIGKALQNQVWLVTHSDAFLRDAKGIPDASIWHMRDWRAGDAPANQASMVSRESDIERAVIDLVGDIAGYRPGARVVIVEGGDAEFDEEMITRLFPGVAARVNIISAGSRTRVEKLHEILSNATRSVGWQARFFAITDRDMDPTDSATQGTSIGLMHWDAYHIENYLLEPRFIYLVWSELNFAAGDFESEVSVSAALREIAETKVNNMVRIHLQREVHKTLQSALTLRIDEHAEDLGRSFSAAVSDTQQAVNALAKGELREVGLRLQESRIRQQHQQYLEDGTWARHFRGRDILQSFVTKYSALRYEDFRNLIIARMRDAGYEPAGMKAVLEQCSQDAADSS